MHEKYLLESKMPDLPDDTNRRIAKWLGWTSEYSQSMIGWQWYWTPPNGRGTHKTPPPYLTDLNACAEFEKVLEERGLWTEYAWSLIELVRNMRIFPSNVSHLKALICATAEQRCAAMVEVIREVTRHG